MKVVLSLERWVAVGIMLLFIGAVSVPSNGRMSGQSFLSISGGTTLYVGGSGPDNYSKIQDAINDSSPGYTVYVYHGTYRETLSINVTGLCLIGEDRESTVIDSTSRVAVTIMQDAVVMRGFKVRAYDYAPSGDGIYILEHHQHVQICDCNLSSDYYGVYIAAYNNYDTVEGSVFTANSNGVFIVNIDDDGHTVVRNNTFRDDMFGLNILSTRDEISNNTFEGCEEGLTQWGVFATIRDNVFFGNAVGLSTIDGENTILRNKFEHNTLGLRGETIYKDVISQNNFINNQRHAMFSIDHFSKNSDWNGNYWGASTYPLGCKVIFGSKETRIPKIIQHIPDIPRFYWIPWINIDRNPAQQPYDIL